MGKKKYDYNSFIPPEEVMQMTDEEYYEYLMTNLRKSEDDLKNGRYVDFDEFVKEFDAMVERDLALENERKNARKF